MKEHKVIDFALIGEYELIIKDLLDALEGKKKLKNIPNILYRDNGKVRMTRRSKDPFLGIKFDSLPFPDREDLPVEDYHDMEINGSPNAQMLTSRGCPFQCKFCCTTIMWPGGAYWQRSPENVVDEMVYVRKKYKVKSVYFDDDVVFPNMILGISKELKERGLDIPWTFMGSIHISEDVIKKAVDAGCIGLKFGIESINPEALGGINKTWVKREKVKKFVEMCKKYNLFTHGTFIVGLPNDSRKGILETLKFAMELDLDSFQVYAAVPLPGSPFYKEAKKNGWIVNHEWIYFNGDHPNISYPWLSKEEIENLFNLWLRMRHLLILKRRLKNPHIMIKNILNTEPKFLMLKVMNFLFSKAEKPI